MPGQPQLARKEYNELPKKGKESRVRNEFCWGAPMISDVIKNLSSDQIKQLSGDQLKALIIMAVLQTRNQRMILVDSMF
jgi:hypothetical protein